MNKQKIDFEVLGLGILVGVAMMILFVSIILLKGDPYKLGYSQGVNDTLNNYTCQEKVHQEIRNSDAKVIVLCDGSYCIKCFSTDGYSCDNYYFPADYNSR